MNTDKQSNEIVEAFMGVLGICLEQHPNPQFLPDITRSDMMRIINRNENNWLNNWKWNKETKQFELETDSVIPIREFTDAIISYICDKTTGSLMEKGYIELHGLDADGDPSYRLTEKGKYARLNQ